MAHQRKRHLFQVLTKRRGLWAVIGLLGPRQVGKSTFLRTIEPERSSYLTLDAGDLRSRAAAAPDLFISSLRAETASPVIVDEVTKVPALFDAIKLSVDNERRPGTFILSGSAQFSERLGIRESLTGRIGILQLYPLTTGETMRSNFCSPWVARKFSGGHCALTDAKRRIEHGGMPGICFLRSADERRATIGAWMDTTCFRDILQIRTGRLSGQLAHDLLSVLPELPIATPTTLGAKLRVDVRRVNSHLEALEILFAVIRQDPHPLGIGKPRYSILDSGFHTSLGGSSHGALRIWVINEINAQFMYAGRPLPRIHYYESSRHSEVDIVIKDESKLIGIILSEEQTPSPYQYRTAEAFMRRAPTAQVVIVAPCSKAYSERGATVVPWNWTC